jgi:hypothetical protein
MDFVNDKFERKWKESIVYCFKVPTSHLTGSTKENPGQQSGSRFEPGTATFGDII